MQSEVGGIGRFVVIGVGHDQDPIGEEEQSVGRGFLLLWVSVAL